MLLADEDDLRAAARARAQARLEEIERNEARYDADLAVFAADCLTIRPKEGADTLLRFNAVQRRAHEEIEDQRRRTGRVRKVILKARQPGISTYVGARYYHRTSRGNGLRAFILTHHQDATDNLFEMVKRYHDHNPHAPHTGASSVKELYFDHLDSGFAVGTAGTKGLGRSFTFQLFHGSEVAFWPNASEHASGVLQAVPNVDGSEVVLESTANGIGGFFYNTCIAAQRREGEFELIFIPWFEHEEYASPGPQGWTPPAVFADYGRRHRLTPEQIYWAATKNVELAVADGVPSDTICWRFRREYPATVEEAFRASREGAFISGDLVLRARRFVAPAQDHAPLVLGADIATGGDGEGGDDNVFIDRQGRAAGRHVYERFNDKNTLSVASKLAATIDRLNPAMTFIDAGGGGAAVYDILKGRGYERLCLVSFGGTPRDDRKYVNKRAEMYGDCRDWLADPGGAQVPDCDILDGELTGPMAEEDFHGRVKLQKKVKVKKLIGRSPDGADALVTTFAETVHSVNRDKINPLKPGRSSGGGRQSWMGA